MFNINISKYSHREMDNQVISDFKNDDFISLIKNRIISSLPIQEFKKLEESPYEFNEKLHLKFLLNIYLKIIKKSNIKIKVIDNYLQEPITMYIDKTNDNSIIIHDGFIDNISTQVVHSISLNYIKKFFCIEINNNLIKRQVSKCEKTFDIPNTFFIQSSKEEFSDIKKYTISEKLLEKLIRLYIIADHAAYHYYSFVKNKDFDYKHEKINRIKKESVFFSHNLFTNKPSYSINNFLNNKENSKIDVKIEEYLEYSNKAIVSAKKQNSPTPRISDKKNNSEINENSSTDYTSEED